MTLIIQTGTFSPHRHSENLVDVCFRVHSGHHFQRPGGLLLASSGHLSCAAKDRGLILLLRVTKGRVLAHEIWDGGLVSSAEAAFRGDTEPFDGR